MEKEDEALRADEEKPSREHAVGCQFISQEAWKNLHQQRQKWPDEHPELVLRSIYIFSNRIAFSLPT
jgi:hypothetical protein